MMTWDSILLVGVLFAVSTYLMLSKSYWEILIGFILFSSSVNVVILLASNAPLDAEAPIITEVSEKTLVDPLPHALILTAIVIGFGLTAYFASLIYSLLKEEQHG